jgi:hypothetical protein
VLGEALLFLVGAAVGRWWVLIVPVAVVPAFLLGVSTGWWGDDSGLDSIGPAIAVGLVRGLLATALGVCVRKLSGRILLRRAPATSQK